jgi:hypothetical protein
MSNPQIPKQARQAQKELQILKRKTDPQAGPFKQAARMRVSAAKHGVELGRTDARRLIRQGAQRVRRFIGRYRPKIPGGKMFGLAGMAVKALTDITLREQAKRRSKERGLKEL